MELVKFADDKKIQNLNFIEDIYTDDTEYLFSKPSVARDILEGLATDWEDCVPETEALK